MSYRVVADSSSNLFELPGVDYAFAPLKIVTDEAEYIDNPDLDVADMVEALRHTKSKSSTSCPNAADWLEAFGEAENIIALTITSNLSGSHASAQMAAREYQQAHPQARICVIDTLSTGPEMALLMEKIRDGIRENLSFERICEKVKDYQKHTHLLFCLESMINLARNGRVNPAAAKLAGILGIRAIGVASEEGTLEMLHKCRGERKTLETILQEMIQRGFQGGAARITHCFNLTAAQALKELIVGRFPASNVEIGPCTALCSFYAERGGLLVGFEDGIC